MHQSSLTKLGLLVFGLVFVSFLVRGFGQLLVGPRVATRLGGPIAVLAGGVLVVVVGLWALGRLGLLDIEADESDE